MTRLDADVALDWAVDALDDLNDERIQEQMTPVERQLHSSATVIGLVLRSLLKRQEWAGTVNVPPGTMYSIATDAPDESEGRNGR